MSINPQKGIAILMAVVAVSAMLLMSLAISDISYKEHLLTFFSSDSKNAFYAADAGVECALFHDYGGGENSDFIFATSTHSDPSASTDMHCGDGVPIGVYGAREDISAVTTFYFNIPDEVNPTSCTIVDVTKEEVPDGSVTRTATTILSRGYNTACRDDGSTPTPSLAEDNPRNLERALEVTY